MHKNLSSTATSDAGHWYSKRTAPTPIEEFERNRDVTNPRTKRQRNITNLVVASTLSLQFGVTNIETSVTAIPDTASDFLVGTWTDVFGESGDIAKPADQILEAEHDAVTKDVTERIRLLSRKYARGRLQPEELARLEILSERVRQRYPTLSNDGLDALAALTAELREFKSEDQAIRILLGHEKHDV